MPDAAEVVPLVLELLHLDHFREALDSLDERIFDGLAHAARERHELRGAQLLVTEEDDAVLEKRSANLLDRNLPGKINASDFRAERAGDSRDLHQNVPG
jgi:hypothetical protein